MKTKIENIIVPFENDEVSIFAAEYAVGLAEKEQAKVTLFYVVEHPTDETFNSMGIVGGPSFEGNIFIEKLIEKTEERMMAFIDSHPQTTIKWHIKVGNSYEKLTELIGNEKGDLIVMGTHESKNTSPGFIRSHTEKIINRSVPPVIVLRANMDFLDCKQILFATDFCDLNPTFISQVTALVKLTGAELKIVKVNTPAYFKSSDEDQATYREFLDKFDIQEHEFIVFNDSEVEEGILKTAKACKADLIVVGNHKRSGVHRLALHNTVEALIRHTDIPVWSWKIGLSKKED